LGTSGARGAFVGDAAIRSAAGDMQPDREQTAWGVDAEYSRDYYIVRAEVIVSTWQLPACTLCAAASRAPVIGSLRASALSIEGRYKIAPDFYTAARVDRLDFSTVRGTLTTAPWDAPVTRLEVGAGYSIQRNLLAKVSYQRNRRDGGRLQATAD